MASFRHLKFKNTGQKLTMKNVINLGLDFCYNIEELEKKNIVICELDPQEIKIATQDMVEMLNENSDYYEGSHSLEKTFKNIFCNSELTYKGKMPFHKKNQINFKISKKFLEMNKWWLD